MVLYKGSVYILYVYLMKNDVIGYFVDFCVKEKFIYIIEM